MSKGHGPFNPEPDPVPDPPRVATCAECDLKANPAWGLHGKSYCRFCAPPELKHPTQSSEENRDA